MTGAVQRVPDKPGPPPELNLQAVNQSASAMALCDRAPQRHSLTKREGCVDVTPEVSSHKDRKSFETKTMEDGRRRPLSALCQPHVPILFPRWVGS